MVFTARSCHSAGPMRHRLLPALLLACLLAPPASPAPRRAPRAPVPARVPSTDEWGFIDDLNETRTQQGLRSLSESPALRAAAQRRLADMGARHYFAHESPGGFGYEQIRTIYPYEHGEALAWKGGVFRPAFPPRQALRDLLGSPPHREILLGDFNQVGVAVGPADLPKGKSVIYVVLVGDGPAARAVRHGRVRPRSR